MAWRVCHLVLAAGIAAGVSAPALAGTVVSVGGSKNFVGLQTFGINPANEGAVSVPKFDTMGGLRVLTSVQILASYTISGQMIVQNTTGVAKSAQAVGGVGACTAGAVANPAPTFTPKPNWASDTTANLGASTSSLVNFVFSHNQDLSGLQPTSFFEGAGNFFVNIGAKLLGAGQVFTTSNPSVIITQVFPQSFWRATINVSVQYTYTQGVPPVPLPSASMLGAAGLALVFSRRRRS